MMSVKNQTAKEISIRLISDTIAFHTVLTSYDTIPEGSAVLFNEVLLNEGEGYAKTHLII